MTEEKMKQPLVICHSFSKESLLMNFGKKYEKETCNVNKVKFV